MEILAAFVHPLTLVLLLGVAADLWLIHRRRRRPAPPPDTP